MLVSPQVLQQWIIIKKERWKGTETALHSLQAVKLWLKKEKRQEITSFSMDVVFFSISPRWEAVFSLKICKLLQLIQTVKNQKAFCFLR